MSNSQFDINSPMSIFAMALMPLVGGSMFIIQPAFIQGLVNYVGFTDQSAGYAMSLEMGGFALGTIIIAFIANKINWRQSMRICMFATVVATIGCMLATNETLFVLLRLIVGLATGSIVSLGFTSLGLTEKTERNMGFSIFFCMIYGAIVLYFVPVLFDLAGMDALLAVIMLLTAFGLAVSSHLPLEGQEKYVVEADAVDLKDTYKWLGVFAALLYFLAQGAVWAYVFLFGTGAGLTEETVAFHLTISQFTGIAGALVAVFIGAKFSRLPPLMLGVFSGVIPLALYLYFGVSESIFFIGILIYNFGFNLSHPYLLATMASFDKRGKMVIYAVCAQTMGLAFGPAIGAYLISGDSYANIMIFSITFFLFALLCVALPIKEQMKMLRQERTI